MSSTYNARILLQNDADGATLGASPAFVSGLAEGNLQLQEGAFVARSTDTSDQTITFDFAAQRPVAGDMFVLIGDMSQDCYIDITLYAGANQTGPIVYEDTSLVWTPIPWGEFGPWGQKPWGGGSVFDVSNSQPGYVKVPADNGGEGLYLSGKLVIRDATNPNGYHEFTRLMIGRLLRPQFNVSYGYEIGLIDDSDQEPDDGGGMITFPTEPVRRLSFSLEWLDRSEYAGFWAGINYARKVNDIFIDMRPLDGGIMTESHRLRCKFTDIPAFSEYDVKTIRTQFIVREVK